MNNQQDEATVALRKAAAIIRRLERQLREAELAKHEPIAIIGVGCRLPGGITDLESYWEVLEKGVDTVRPFPEERFDVRRLDDAQGDACVQGGSFLQGVDGFDPEFWGLSQREARWIDPQHRLLLECAWEALENACVPAQGLRNTRVGVYVGTGTTDYGTGAPFDENDVLDVFSARLGSSFAAGRISFLLGLQGPAIAIETACSSSLVALHLACRALRAGECEMALAGGAQVLTTVEPFIVLSKIGALSRDGRCKSFSLKADGYGRAEGCGVVTLKRWSDAQRAGDRVLGLIRGSAVNHDGPRSALTTPNAMGQRAVLRQALDDARLTPEDIDYVEAHAVGTSLGDAIEIEAIADVYGRARRVPLPIGSAKGNIGHLEPASGIAGVLKLLAQLDRQAFPASQNVEALNPHLDWSATPVRVVTKVESWTRSERPRRAAISAFGLSGTNAHLLLEEAPAPAVQAPSAARSAELVVLSAKTPLALNAGAARLSRYLRERPAISLVDVANSLATTRAPMRQRLALAVRTRDELVDALARAGAGETPGGVVRGEASLSPGKVAWLFRGGNELPTRASKELGSEWPAFRDALDAAQAAVEPLLPKPLADARGDSSTRTFPPSDVDQPATFCLGWAMAALWRSWGVAPNMVVGHSEGSITAACLAGVFSLADAARLVCARQRLARSMPRCEAAATIVASEATVAEMIAPHLGRIRVAAIEPSHVTIAGAERDVAAALTPFAANKITTRRVELSIPNTALLAEADRLEWVHVVRSIHFQAPTLAIGSIQGPSLPVHEFATPVYWETEPLKPARLEHLGRVLGDAGVETIIDISPPARTLDGQWPTSGAQSFLSSLELGRGASASMLGALGGWFAGGGLVDYSRVFPADTRRVNLPTYAWQRERCWI